MAKVIGGDVARKETQERLAEFVAMRNVVAPLYRNLTGAQKSAILNTFNNWSSATTEQKLNALYAAIALLYIAVFFLIRREVDNAA